MEKYFRRKQLCRFKNDIDRPIISETIHLEETLNDVNRVFESNKECSNAFQSVQKHRLQNPKNIVIGHLNVNYLRNKFEAVEELQSVTKFETNSSFHVK